jgi:hypothetical protein
MQRSHSVDPSELMKRPAKHKEQAEEPDSLLNFPIKQLEHTSSDIAPTIELDVPEMHCSHSVEPSPETYLPA